MTAQNETFVSELELAEEKRPWKAILIFLVVAIALHMIFLPLKFNWLTASIPAPRVDLQQIDPRKLDAIRRQWRNQEKELVLDKDPSKPHEKEAPRDARFISDKNTRVEKEQRARVSGVVPTPGRPGTQGESRPRVKNQKRPSATLPNLGNLGVPLGLTVNNSPDSPDPLRAKSQAGHEQSFLDKTLPEGSENLLNTQESIYYSFYARLYEEIGPIWQSKIRQVPRGRKVMQGEYTTSVDVVFDREGNLVAVHVLQPSGIREFDSAVDESWKKIGRFPNPPTGLLNEVGEVHTGWSFSVQVGSESALEYLPPERTY